MTETLPDPPISTEVDLTDFAFMPLEVRRLRDSKLAASVDGEQFRCTVLLWCAAWHQVPAGSLPDDDVELTQLAGFGRAVQHWKKVRAGALYGWEKCSDGRLYHSVVVEKALEAWNSKLDMQYRREIDRLRKENKRRAENKEVPIMLPSFEEWSSQRRPPDFQRNSDGRPADSSLKGEGSKKEVRSKGQGHSLGAPANPSGGNAFSDEAWTQFWGSIRAIYPAGTYRQTDFLIGEREARKRLDDGFTADELYGGTERFAAQKKSTGKVGSQYVLSPAKFFAENAEARGTYPFTDEFPVPKTPGEARQDNNIDAARAWLAESGAT